MALAVTTVTGAATDWPQFLGPTRNGTYGGPPLADAWGPAGPKVVWRKQIGQGFAGPAVVGNRVILFHRVGNEEVLESLDAATGNSLWRYAYRTTYRDDFGFDEGPRAVPVVADGVIYTFGAEGQLHAVDFAKGTRLWSEDTMKRFGVPKGFFGAGGSPLVEGGSRHRQHRRRQSGHRRVRGQDRQGRSGRPPMMTRAIRRAWRPRLAAVDPACFSLETISSVSTPLPGASSFSGDGGPGSLRRSTRRRRSSSATRSSCRHEYGPGAGVLRVNGSTTGGCLDVRRSAVEPLRDERLSRWVSVRLSRPPGIRPEPPGRGIQDRARSSGVRISSAPAASRWPATSCSSLREGGELILAAASPQAFGRSPGPRSCRAWSGHMPAIADGLSVRPQREHAGLPRPAQVKGPRLALVSIVALAVHRRCSSRAENPRDLLDRAIEDFLAGRVAESVTGLRSSRRRSRLTRHRSSGSAVSRCTTSAVTRTAASSSNPIEPSIPTTSRIPPGTSCASRSRSHHRRHAPGCCPSAPISARRCARSTRCFAARCRPRRCSPPQVNHYRRASMRSSMSGCTTRQRATRPRA